MSNLRNVEVTNNILPRYYSFFVGILVHIIQKATYLIKIGNTHFAFRN